MTIGWNPSGSNTSNRKILLFVVDNVPNPKSTTLISNITY